MLESACDFILDTLWMGVPQPSTQPSSTWTSGDKTLEVRLVYVLNGTARLQKRDGKTIDVAIERLYPEDRAFISSKQKHK